MALPKLRYDGYGQPLPELAEARNAAKYETPVNQRMRALLLRLLEEQFRAVLRQDVHAEVHIVFVVQRGVIQRDASIDVLRRYRDEQED